MLSDLWGAENHTPFVKDGIHETIVKGAQGKVNPQGTAAPKLLPTIHGILVQERRKLFYCVYQQVSSRLLLLMQGNFST